jgi:hypothetical protein
MANQVYPITDTDAYRKAGPQDLMELLPAEGSNKLFIKKWILEAIGYGIAHCEFIHLSGPTGTAKSSVIEALHLVPDNFRALCKGLGLAEKPVQLYPIEMVTYETPGELYQRRALKDGTTYDEQSKLVASLREAETAARDYYPLIWLREMGRVHSSTVQGGLLNLMTKSDILLPNGDRIPGQHIAWISDSNYQAENDSTHTLVTFDDALKRRFTLNITLEYLPVELEKLILTHLLKEEKIGKVDQKLIRQVVLLGHEIRRLKAEGQLQSVIPPTIYGYLAFLRMVKGMSHFTCQQVAAATLLGNTSIEDQTLSNSLINQIFGFQMNEDEQMPLEGNMF